MPTGTVANAITSQSPLWLSDSDEADGVPTHHQSRAAILVAMQPDPPRFDLQPVGRELARAPMASKKTSAAHRRCHRLQSAGFVVAQPGMLAGPRHLTLAYTPFNATPAISPPAPHSYCVALLNTRLL